MTDKQENLLAVLNVRIHDLMNLCDKQRLKIGELTEQLETQKKLTTTLKEEISVMQDNYDRLLIAKSIELEKGKTSEAHKRLEQLVREVDKCIALLNE